MAWIFIMMSGILAAPAAPAKPAAAAAAAKPAAAATPAQQEDRIAVIKKHFKVWGTEQSLHRLKLRGDQSCGVAIYQAGAAVEGGLAYLAQEHRRHHIFDGVLNKPVDQLKLITSDYDFVLEGYLQNHFCDEAHLYMNLPNRKEFEKQVSAETEAATKDNVKAYFHNNAIFQKALPAILTNRGFTKLVVHRVIGFTHASCETDDSLEHEAIDKSELYSDELANIFNKVHIMDPVEFDLEQYRKDQKIAICETDEKHSACSDVGNKEWHRLDFKTEGLTHKPILFYKTKGLTDFVDSMLFGLAEEYQVSVQSPSSGKGAESFKSIWQESQKKEKVKAYNDCVSPSVDEDLTHCANQEEWPAVMSSVAKLVKTGIRSEDSAITYEKYVAGSDIRGLLPLLALGIPFLMYR